MSENKKKTARILVPVIIISLVIGIWVLKNTEKKVPALSGLNPDFALHVTTPLDLEHLKSYGLPIIIDFGADSCAPCIQMAPVLEKLNKELQGKAIIKFVDVWKYRDLAGDFPISVIPTQIFFDSNGDPYVPSDTLGYPMTMYSLRATDEHVFTAHEGGMTEEMLLAVLYEMGLEE